MSQTPNLLITEVAANQSQKEVTINNALVELDGAITALLTVALSDADYDLTTTEGGQALGNAAFKFTGALSASRNIIVPATPKFYAVQNDTSMGGSPAAYQTIVVKTSGGTGVTINQGTTGYTLVYCDGTDVLPVEAVAGASALSSDTDVDITSPSNGDLLTYNSGASKWENQPASSAPPTAIAGVNTQSTSYTLVLGDAGYLVRMNVTGANNLTVPLNSSVAFPLYTVISVRQVGAGVTTIVATGGVTITSPSTLAIARQYGTVQLIKVGTDTWDLAGDVT